MFDEERGRNALLLAAAIAARGDRGRAVATMLRSLSGGWRYPRWWYGVAKAVVGGMLERMQKQQRAGRLGGVADEIRER